MSDRSNFYQELKRVLNATSQERFSDTPDFVLAGYLLSCLNAYEAAILQRNAMKALEPKPLIAPDPASTV